MTYLTILAEGGNISECLGSWRDPGYWKTLWEIRMMQIMNSITDKSEWHEKVFNEGIIRKWREELTMSDVDLTSGMIDWIFEELKYKASLFQQTGMVTAFDADVVKSDSAIPEELRLALMSAVRPLEEVPEEQKDYHPSSGETVVDLVHPSLFPLVYGRSRMLKDKITTLERFMEYSAKGDVVPIPPEKETRVNGFPRRRRDTPGRNPFSQRFQWLPCDVELNKDSNDCRIVSYINNLHPHKNGGLYDIIQQIITRTIPLWNATLTPVLNSLYLSNNRIEYTYVDCSRGNTPEPTQKRIIHSDGESETDESDEDDFWDRVTDWEHSRPVRPPGIGAFRPLIGDDKEKVDLQTAFKDTGLQVIVKLANIELTPEKPDYAGGSWHVEGQLNEHICATAIYYYSNDNIATNNLCFRQRLNTAYMSSQIRYQQGYVEWTEPVFGCEENGPVTQELGGVSCSQGRLLTFPNILQHHVSPFHLADPTKHGHRKILALFLIDPHIRITSTANVAPQREDWYEEAINVRRDVLEPRLPLELQNMVTEQLGDFPISMEEAKDLRLELMKERSAVSDDRNELFSQGSFSLCEH